MLRRLVVAGLAALLAAPAFLIQPASAAVLFSCSSVTGSAVLSPGLLHDNRPQNLASGPTARAGPADITLASTTDTGVKADGDSGSFSHTGPSLSGDGTKVAFSSSSTNLDPADSDTFYDVYVKNLVTGDIVLASTSDAGVKGSLDSYAPVLSIDGTKVAFWSASKTLDPADTDRHIDVYVKDLVTGDIVLASTSDTGVKGNNLSWYPSLSADGTKVAFASMATNLHPADGDTGFDIYVKNLRTGNLKLASRTPAGAKGNGESTNTSLAADGTAVAFESKSTNLDPADTDTGRDIYVKDLGTGDIALVSTSELGVTGDGEDVHPTLGADGVSLGFQSNSTNLDPRDADSALYDTYVKNLATGNLTLVSLSDTGAKGSGGPIAGTQSLSSDGKKVSFSTQAKGLDLADTTDDDWDLYVKDLDTGDLTLASTSDHGVKGNGPNYGGDLSADGTVLAFQSSSNNLDSADTESLFSDIYVKDLPTVPTSIDIAGCSNGQTGTASIVDIRSYGPRPLGCPVALGGAAGNDYPDTTPILVGVTLSMTIDWASGPNSYGVAAAKAGPTGTQWRFRLAIAASPGHDTPATNQYLPAAGSDVTKTRLQGKLDVSALDSFNCTTGVDDPLSWLSLANNGTWVAKTS